MIELACSQFWSCLHLDYWCFLLLLPGRKPFYVTIDSWDREDVCVWLPPSVRGRGSAKTHTWLRWNDYGRTWLMALPPIGLLEDWAFLHADDQEVCSILHFRTTGFPGFYDLWYAGMCQQPNITGAHRALYLQLYDKGEYP